MNKPTHLRTLYFNERARTLYTLPEPPRWPESLAGLRDSWEARKRREGRTMGLVIELDDYRNTPKGAA